MPKVINLLVSKNAYFLDIGCGPRDYLVEAQKKKSKNVVGVDLDKK